MKPLYFFGFVSKKVLTLNFCRALRMKQVPFLMILHTRLCKYKKKTTSFKEKLLQCVYIWFGSCAVRRQRIFAFVRLKAGVPTVPIFKSFVFVYRRRLVLPAISYACLIIYNAVCKHKKYMVLTLRR